MAALGAPGRRVAGTADGRRPGLSESVRPGRQPGGLQDAERATAAGRGPRLLRLRQGAPNALPGHRRGREHVLPTASARNERLGLRRRRPGATDHRRGTAEEPCSRPAAVVVPQRSASARSGTRRTTVRPAGHLPARLFRRPGGHEQLATAPGPQPARRTAAEAVAAAAEAQEPGVRTVRGHRAVFAGQAVHARTAAAAERKPPRLAAGHAAGAAEAGRAAGGTVAVHGEGAENRRDGARTPATETGVVSRAGGGCQSVRRPATDTAEDRRGQTEDGRVATTLSTTAVVVGRAAAVRET